MRSLDLDQVRAFVVVADLRSFTAAGACLAASQSAISLRLSKLEQAVGRRLLARTPRAVTLTPDGARFLPHARSILDAHDRAWAAMDRAEERTVLRLGLSDHAVGSSLPTALASLRVSLPLLAPDVSVGLSSAMRAAYDRGEVDVAIVRQEGERRDGTLLFTDPLVWARATTLEWRPDEPVPVVALHGTCGVKSASTRALDTAGLPWRFSFQGGSVMALQAAVRAGLGVAAFGARHLPEECIADRTLPELPAGHVMLHTRLDGATRRVLAAAFKAVGSA